MKTALVTGGTGFVGANLVRRLLREGHRVHLLARPGYAVWRIRELIPELVLHEAPLDDRRRLTDTVKEIKPDWIFHLAAHGAYSWQNDSGAIISANLAGTVNLLEACLETGFEAFVNTGSSSEYGFKDHAPAETECPEPNGCYAVTKAAATNFCRYISRARNVHAPTLRLYSVYGPYEDPRRLIPALVVNGLAGRLPPLVSPATARDYVYAEDVCDAYLLAAARTDLPRGSIYNVGTGIQTTMREAVETARGVLRLAAEPGWGTMPARTWDTEVWVADSSLIRRELGWAPRFSFVDGFRKTADWFSAHPELLEHYRGKEQG
ncbi:MAG TPA: NAD-dependent epimerase/dehydratase family protein [Elusimicrobiales bacterium]|nr:NAD-dependent epimerase/dehydratase family protein [Elusimicrobiales bacterium]